MNKSNVFQYAGLLLCLMSASALSDDTEIFFGEPPADDAVPPFVMLSMDWRPNTGSNEYACDFDTDPDISDCDDSSELGPDIYNALVEEGRLTNDDEPKLFDVLRGALRVVFDEIEPLGFSIGLMMSHQNDNNCTSTHGALGSDKGCSDGGFILRGFDVVDGSTDGQASKNELLGILKNMPHPQDSAGGHPYQGRELFFEFYRYLTGGAVLNGHKGWSDFDSDKKQGKSYLNLDQEYLDGDGNGSATSGNGDCDFETQRGCDGVALPAGVDANENSDGTISPWMVWDMDIDNGINYISPFTAGDYSCSKVYTVNFLFGETANETDWNTEISRDIGSASNKQGLGLANTKNEPNTFTEILAKLHSLDVASTDVGLNIDGVQNVTSFFVSKKNQAKQVAYAQAGGGRDAPIDLGGSPEELLDELLSLFRSIASVSTTFTAASVPVNVQNRTEALPDIFMALFKVDPDGYPLWPGNVKKLKVESTLLNDGSTSIEIVDEPGTEAFNQLTGQIKEDALTFWTDPAALDVLTPDPDAVSDNSGKDGNSITRGGAGHRLPGYRVDVDNNPKTANPTAANVSPSIEGDADGRQLFLSPVSVNGKASTGNVLIPLNADDASVLNTDTEIQKLLGLRDAADVVDETEAKSILDLAAVAYSGADTADDLAEKATQVLLKWARGINVFGWDDNPDDGYTPGRDAARPWMMGDPLHSRPLTLNYGTLGGYTEAHQDVRILFGTSDGFLHSIRNTTSAGAGDESGVEEWAFMPRELLAHIPDLIKRTFVGDDKPYGVDLPPVAFVIDNDRDGTIERGSGGNASFCTPGGDDQSGGDPDVTDLDCDKAYVYVGLRRGGKSYYGLDISAPDDEPRLLWQITNEGAGTDFEELGMSISTPRQAWVRFETDGALNTYNGENVPIPVLIFGGGLYGGWTADRSGRVGRDDLSYDVTTDPVAAGHDPEGAALFMVHARTGELIWKAVYGASEGGVSANEYHHNELIHSIPAAVTPIDSDGNGITDRVYVGDTGGNVWRFELPEFDPVVAADAATPAAYATDFREDYWRATKLAELGGSVGSVNDRRFYHGLSIVQGKDSIGRYDGIAIGSGDRTHPRSAPSTIQNKFFLIKDREVYADADLTANTGVDGRTPWVIGDLLDVTSTCLNDSNNDADGSNQCSAADLANGWRLDLGEAGEKNLSIPLISGNNVNFTTYLPEGGEDEGACAPSLGISRLYQVAIRDGSPDIYLRSHVEGDTLSASDRYLDLASGIDGGVTAVSPNTGLAGSQQVKLGDQRPNTYFWREINVDVLDK